MLVLTLLVLCSVISRLQSEFTCNGLYSNFSQHLASKTPYRYVANYDTEPTHFEGESSDWFVGRSTFDGFRIRFLVSKSVVSIYVHDRFQDVNHGKFGSFRGMVLERPEKN